VHSQERNGESHWGGQVSATSGGGGREETLDALLKLVTKFC
jgi:hypothetical protein